MLADGEEGELVLTTFTRRGMPMVRYRTRDLTRLLPGTARPMRRIAKVTGRSDDMMIVRGVNVFPTQIEELILATSELSPHFQCVLTRPGRMDELTVRVERRPDADGIVRGDRRSGAAAPVKNRIGVTIAVRRRRAGRHRALPGQDAPHHRRALSLSLRSSWPRRTARAATG